MYPYGHSLSLPGAFPIERTRAAYPDLAGRAGCHGLAAIVEEAKLDAIGGAARRLAARVGDVERRAVIGQHRSRRHGLGLAKPLDQPGPWQHRPHARSEEHTSELQSLMRISYAVFCLKKKIYFHCT